MRRRSARESEHSVQLGGCQIFRTFSLQLVENNVGIPQAVRLHEEYMFQLVVVLFDTSSSFSVQLRKLPVWSPYVGPLGAAHANSFVSVWW